MEWGWGSSPWSVRINRGSFLGLNGQGFPSQPQWLSTSFRCWFQKEPALYATVHGYFLVTFLCGAVVLTLVAWKIFTLPTVTAGKGPGQTWKSVLTVLGLSSLVGITWGLSVLTPLGLSTTYIFTVLNSLQGEVPGGHRPSHWHQGPLGGREGTLQDTGFHRIYLKSKVLILYIQDSWGTRASRVASVMEVWIRKSHIFQSRLPLPFALELSIVSHLASKSGKSLSLPHPMVHD